MNDATPSVSTSDSDDSEDVPIQKPVAILLEEDIWLDLRAGWNDENPTPPSLTDLVGNRFLLDVITDSLRDAGFNTVLVRANRADYDPQREQFYTKVIKKRYEGHGVDEVLLPGDTLEYDGPVFYFEAGTFPIEWDYDEVFDVDWDEFIPEEAEDMDIGAAIHLKREGTRESDGEDDTLGQQVVDILKDDDDTAVSVDVPADLGRSGIVGVYVPSFDDEHLTAHNCADLFVKRSVGKYKVFDGRVYTLEDDVHAVTLRRAILHGTIPEETIR